MRSSKRLASWATDLVTAIVATSLAACTQDAAQRDEDDGEAGEVGARDVGPVRDAGGSDLGPMLDSGRDQGPDGEVPAFRRCVDPQPIVVLGVDTGYVACEATTGRGWRHRARVVACPSLLPRGDVMCDAGGAGECSRDADCVERPNGLCRVGFDIGDCGCHYGCRTDADCGPGHVCQCGDPIGYCIASTCTSDTDCGGGLCATYDSGPECGQVSYACQTPHDTCSATEDCAPQRAECVLVDGRRACGELECYVPGRPFLVNGEARRAPLAQRSDWQAEGLKPRSDGLSAAERAALAVWWSRAGQLEHASVAAFARFSLELLTLGAPAELVAGASRAMADETEHARLCFGLASFYAGHDIGPGPLALDGALGAPDLASSLDAAFREGCLGETIAAAEAEEAALACEEPTVRAVLQRIAADERRHAELAWVFVAWALDQVDAPTRTRSIARFAAALREALDAPSPTELAPAVPTHGLLAPRFRAAVHRTALEAVVLPCARALRVA